MPDISYFPQHCIITQTTTVNFGERPAANPHRAAYRMFIGPIPRGYVVMHSCDNPPCINPRHLSAGTYADNSRDMVNKGRCRSKLTIEQVREIRASTESETTLGRRYSVANATIWAIRAGRIWRGRE